MTLFPLAQEIPWWTQIRWCLATDQVDRFRKKPQDSDWLIWTVTLARIPCPNFLRNVLKHSRIAIAPKSTSVRVQILGDHKVLQPDSYGKNQLPLSAAIVQSVPY